MKQSDRAPSISKKIHGVFEYMYLVLFETASNLLKIGSHHTLERFLTLWLLVLLVCSASSQAAEVPSHIGGEQVFYYYDSQGSMDVESIRQDVSENRQFENFADAEVPVGSGNHWVFFNVAKMSPDAGSSSLIEVEFPNIDRIDADIFYANGKKDKFLTGDEVAFSQWPVSYRKPSLPLNFISESDATVFLCIKSETPLILPIRLVQKSEQTKNQLYENFLYGIFYGAIFILAIYNAGVYVSLRDKSYRFYILYILAFSVVQASTTGLGQQYLWPNLDGATTRIALLAIILTQYFMIQFVIHFLDLPRFRPSYVKPLKLSAYFALLLAPMLLLPHYGYTQYLIHFANFLGMVAIIFATVSVLKINRTPAIYLLASYTVLFSAIMLALLFQADLIAHYTYIDFSMSAAILIEAIILSIGLSDRIAKLRGENEAAEREHRMVQEQLSQQLIQAREQERSEISRLLHDSVNHDLVVVRNKLSQLTSSDHEDLEQARASLAPIDALLNKAIEQVRNISHLKHPQMIKHLGLQTALEALVDSTFGDSLTVNVHVEDIPLPYEVQLFIYRTAQEATTNIIKHASATECIMRLSQAPDSEGLIFLVRDDGVGFDAKGRHWRFGLRTLNEYCKSLRGTFTITSSPEDGTTISILLPDTQGSLS